MFNEILKEEKNEKQGAAKFGEDSKPSKITLPASQAAESGFTSATTSASSTK